VQRDLLAVDVPVIIRATSSARYDHSTVELLPPEDQHGKRCRESTSPES